MKIDGLIVRQSLRNVKETTDAIIALMTQKSITVYTRIDQQAELGKVGMTLAPMEFLLFGKPQNGGKLIREIPEVAIDLPLKLICWEDEGKKVWVAFNEAVYIAHRFSMPASLIPLIDIDALIVQALKN